MATHLILKRSKIKATRSQNAKTLDKRSRPTIQHKEVEVSFEKPWENSVDEEPSRSCPFYTTGTDRSKQTSFCRCRYLSDAHRIRSQFIEGRMNFNCQRQKGERRRLITDATWSAKRRWLSHSNEQLKKSRDGDTVERCRSKTCCSNEEVSPCTQLTFSRLTHTSHVELRRTCMSSQVHRLSVKSGLQLKLDSLGCM